MRRVTSRGRRNAPLRKSERRTQLPNEAEFQLRTRRCGKFLVAFVYITACLSVSGHRGHTDCACERFSRPSSKTFLSTSDAFLGKQSEVGERSRLFKTNRRGRRREDQKYRKTRHH
ncbi:hypothetical protein AGIG_G3674 [Arapaima gigas]